MISRADALAALERDHFDIVVVGGGITGAGVAFDAATRGYSVALVEKGDFVVRADNVVNATGVWADRLRPEELHDEAEVPRISPSRGTHITLRHADLPLPGGAIVPAGG